MLIDRDTGETDWDADLAEELVEYAAVDRTVGVASSIDEETERRLADLGYR